VLTGVAIYKPSQQAWLTRLFYGYTVARFLHFWITMAFLAFFLVHVGQVIRTGWNNFRGMVTGYEIVTEEDKALLVAERGQPERLFEQNTYASGLAAGEGDLNIEDIRE